MHALRRLSMLLIFVPVFALAEDVSAPVILQYFESRYGTIEERLADVFKCGYGAVYTPPTGRADQGNFSVGYDPYDRFDLGKPGNYTLYGSETGLKNLVKLSHRAGLDYYVDFIINHNGYSDLSSTDGGGNSFYDAGGYPGMCISLAEAIDGDFHSSFDGGDLNGRLAGLIDINHSTNFRFFRSPVPGLLPKPGDHGGNIRAGTQFAFGRIANVPDENNRRFYPDKGLNPIYVFDPKTGEQNIAVYPYNLANPLAGDPVAENGMGYLMRNAQWLVQTVGVDGFRIDAAKHVEGFALDFFDRAVYRSSFRSLHNGAQKQIFSFCEVFDGNKGYLQSFVVKTIDPGNPGRIGGNRDALDFSLFFALSDNLTGNGIQNSWYNIRNATLDTNDDGNHNGSSGVMFAGSHDSFGPYLSNVAYAYVLMHPGNAIVYFNAHEFGDANARNFPKTGRGDSLGGLYGNSLKTLVDIRNRYGRGNYQERWIEKELFAYERSASCIVLLSNRVDGGYDSRTINTNFSPGTRLIELTGNASSASADPHNDIPELLTVNGDGTVNVRFLRNVAPGTNNFTGKGYLIYGPASPQGTLSLTNVTQTLDGGTPTDNTNGTTRLADIKVIKADSFQIKLNTSAVNLLGSIREIDADGDNAIFKVDDGMDLNGTGEIDYRNPGVTYGFEEFKTTHSPGYGSADGDGTYVQTIDATKLSEGIHFITVRCFRHRSAGRPAVFTDFREVIYIDRAKPNSVVESFKQIVEGVNENRQLIVRSPDFTADSVHVFLDLPANLTDEQILAQVGSGNKAGQIDRDLFAYGFSNLKSGNHVVTIVTYERDGTVNVQRVPGLFTSTIFGAGLGDLNFDGNYTTADVDIFRTLLEADNSQFNCAADFNANGLIDVSDMLLFGEKLHEVNADGETLSAFDDLVADYDELNEFPIAGDDTAATAEDTLLIIAAVTLLQNDQPGPAGEETQNLTLVSVNSPSAQGGVVMLDAGIISYFPPAEFFGTDTFTYTVMDDGVSNSIPDPKSVTASVTITITPVNDAPISNGTSATTLENISAGIDAAELTLNDFAGPPNEIGQNLTLTDVAATSENGGTIVYENDTVTYTPPVDFSGVDSFAYTVADDGNTNGAADPKSATGTVTVTVTAVNPPPNEPPLANDDLFTTAEDAAVIVGIEDILANDIAGPQTENAQTLTIIAVASASAEGGEIQFVGGVIAYAPRAEFHGVDSFTYTIQDNGTTDGLPDPLTATGTIVVIVTSVNDAPKIVTGVSVVPQTVKALASAEFSVSASDVEGDALSYSWDFGDGTTATGNPATHIFTDSGQRTVTVSISDGQDSITSSLTVEVIANALVVNKLSIKLNFAKPAIDAIQVSGTLPTPQDFEFLNAAVVFNMGGLAQSFTLDAKGKSPKSQSASLTLSKPKNGNSSYLLKMKGSFAAQLADEGLVNDNRKNAPVQIRVTGQFDAQFFEKRVDAQYTAKKNKSGAAK